MKHEDTFFDSTLREALTGETPPDVLARVLQRAAQRSEAATGRSAAGRVTTRRWVSRLLGALSIGVLAGGAAAFAAVWFAPKPAAPAQDSLFATLAAADRALDRAQERVAQLDGRALAREAELARLQASVATLEFALLAPEEKVERAMVSLERRRAERFARMEAERRERHLAWVQEVRRQERQEILRGLDALVSMSAEQRAQAEKILEGWGNSVEGAFVRHYHPERGARRERKPAPDCRETMDSVLGLNEQTRDALRALLDGRQQLAFDAWLANGGGGALAAGANVWVPPAVDAEDMTVFDEWQR